MGAASARPIGAANAHISTVAALAHQPLCAVCQQRVGRHPARKPRDQGGAAHLGPHATAEARDRSGEAAAGGPEQRPGEDIAAGGAARPAGAHPHHPAAGHCGQPLQAQHPAGRPVCPHGPDTGPAGETPSSAHPAAHCCRRKKYDSVACLALAKPLFS